MALGEGGRRRESLIEVELTQMCSKCEVAHLTIRRAEWRALNLKTVAK